ncbi:hypothetical protein M0Q97_03550 [Candidatus Dojkabacteria bacterium]|jgi:dUTPase|nr:hypothetical protein [Candidatus Dojkabacteria bacterium]
MELNFTKFFDVKSPIGIEQREKEDLSIGIDLFMPNPTEEFFNQILNANKEKYFRLKFIENDGFIIIDKGNHKILIRYNYRENEYNIYDDIQIPSGIGIDIPEGYHLVNRSKSSNFKNNFTSIEGLIDYNYTFGMGIQLIVLDKTVITLKPEEKISQILLEKSNPITKFNYITLNEWDKLKSIKEKRNQRSGGFGSTTKF